MMAVSVGHEPFSASPPRVLFEGCYARMVSGALNYDVNQNGDRFLMLNRCYARMVSGALNYDVNQNGDRFLMLKSEREEQDLVVVLNWFEELKARVPTGR